MHGAEDSLTELRARAQSNLPYCSGVLMNIEQEVVCLSNGMRDAEHCGLSSIAPRIRIVTLAALCECAGATPAQTV